MLGCHVRSSADQISLTTSCAVVLGESASLLKDLWFPVLGVVADYKTRSSQHINRPSNLLSQKRVGQAAGVMGDTTLAIIGIAHRGMKLAMDRSAWKVTRTRHGVP
jgi:hypothetical protein